MAESTGGRLSSICETLWEFDDFNRGQGSRSRFLLEQVPVPETIEVFVLLDGTERTDISGLWEYDAETNGIAIEPPALPRPGDVLEVTYQAMCLF